MIRYRIVYPLGIFDNDYPYVIENNIKDLAIAKQRCVNYFVESGKEEFVVHETLYGEKSRVGDEFIIRKKYC